MAEGSSLSVIDKAFEFSAPQFFNFVDGETNEEAREAELWFDSALSYAPSPLMPRIREGRSYNIESMCDFGENQGEKESQINCPQQTKPREEPLSSTESEETAGSSTETKVEKETRLVNRVTDCKVPSQANMDRSTSIQESESAVVEFPSNSEATDDKCQNTSSAIIDAKTCTPKLPTASRNGNTRTSSKNTSYTVVVAKNHTPNLPTASRNENVRTSSKKHETAKKIASVIKNGSALKPKVLPLSAAKSNLPASVKRETNLKKLVGTPSIAQENQAIKRQKLEGGRTRQILNPKPQTLPHKLKVGLATGSYNLCSSVTKNNAGKDGRKMYVREPATPFISVAEMMKKFQSSTREVSLPHSTVSQRPKLTLTRPKEPGFETAQRLRPTKVKSSAELEEEMMAKIPKFKARPFNKKILEAPTFLPLPKSTPQPPEFLEFRLETMARAKQNSDSASVASTETSRQEWKPHLTTPKCPVLHTLLRARPPKVKSSVELEQEELEKVPKFKARPLNKKIFESKGGLGIFCNLKKEVTKPQEFNFATSERIPPPVAVVDMFDKLSLNSEPCHDNPIPRNTKPNPFHLKTEERGAEKERKFITELMQKRWEDELAKIPKAAPYPYTTDFPVIPPKPEPKQCTRPEPFQLESLVRHEEEMRREMEERHRKEMEEAQMRIFKAQPVLKEDPIPVTEKLRKPLTQVQEFNHHVDNRAVERAEFDHKVREKEMMYKRYREESDAARMMEEEKALKQMRRTLVHHARPVPKFDNPFRPQKSAMEITKAKSPNLRVHQRRRRIVNAVSSAATNMR